MRRGSRSIPWRRCRRASPHACPLAHGRLRRVADAFRLGGAASPAPPCSAFPRCLCQQPVSHPAFQPAAFALPASQIVRAQMRLAASRAPPPAPGLCLAVGWRQPEVRRFHPAVFALAHAAEAHAEAPGALAPPTARRGRAGDEGVGTTESALLLGTEARQTCF